MQIAIVSDIHDNRANLDTFLTVLSQHHIDYMLLLGDYGGPGAIMSKLLSTGLPIHAIRGNNDGEICKTMEMFFAHRDHAKIARKYYDWLELDNKKIFLTHYNDLAKPMAISGLYDAVFYGHDHCTHQEYIGDCLLANPGSILGNKTPASFALWDTETNVFDVVTL